MVISDIVAKCWKSILYVREVKLQFLPRMDDRKWGYHLTAASFQILEIIVQVERSGEGCWAEGRDEEKRDPCKDSGTTLPILCESTNETAVEIGLWALFWRCRRSKQPLSSLTLQSKPQTYHAWSWAMCVPLKKPKLGQSKCTPPVTSPYQLALVDAQ